MQKSPAPCFSKASGFVPTVNGELYTDKPILYFWLVLIASKLTDSVNEWTVRTKEVAPSKISCENEPDARQSGGQTKVGLIAATVLALYQWIGQLFFGAVVFIGLALPIGTWILRRDTFWIGLPAAIVLTFGGILTIVFIRKRQPRKVVTAVTLLMTLFTVSLSVWIFPYVDQFKSRRPFSMAVKKVVPATAPLYIYADTMNDFNFYTERDIIPVLFSRSEVAEVVGQSQ